MGNFAEKYAQRTDIVGRLYRYGVRVKLYFKFPDSFFRDLKMAHRKPRARKLGILYHSPNFIFREGIDEKSIIVDVGCGYEADFSRFMIAQFGACAYGIDPTKKHKKYLEKLETSAKGKFVYMQNAVSSVSGDLLFYEIENRESGSLLPDHTNIMQDVTISYKVKSLTLKEIPHRINQKKVDLIKLDIEGAEYDLFDDIEQEDLMVYDQIYIEFHHNAIESKSFADTQMIVNKLCELGFTSFSLDDLNYLFYRDL